MYTLLANNNNLKEETMSLGCYGHGCLGKDPEVKDLGEGNSMITFSVASNSWSKGEQVTDWYNCTWFTRTDNKAVQFLKMGTRIFIKGTWSTRQGETRSGEKITYHNLILRGYDAVEILPKANQRSDKPVKEQHETAGGRLVADDQYIEEPTYTAGGGGHDAVGGQTPPPPPQY